MNAIVTTNQQSAASNNQLSMLMDVQKFEHMVRVAKIFAVSPLFPAHLRGGAQDIGIANAVLVLNMAFRLNEDPLAVAQNIYFVGGKPGWNTSYCIAKANQHGVFRDPIDWEITGNGDSLSVVAFGILSGTGKKVSVKCDMAMAKAEGWTKNAKYTSMPEQMLRYRSAAFLIRLYCPEVMIGVPSAVELELESRDVTPISEPVAVKANADAPIDGEVVETDRRSSMEAEKATQAKDAALKAEASAKATEARNAEAKRLAEEKRLTAEKEAATAATTAARSEVTAGTQETVRRAAAPDRERFDHILEMILTEFQNGADPAEINDLYGPQIEQIRAHFPDMAARLDDAQSKD